MATDKITVYSTAWCSDCRRAKKVLDKFGAPYDWIDIDQHPQGVDFVLEVNHGFRTVPTIVFPDGSVMVEPSNRALAEKLQSLGGQDRHL